MLLLIIKRLHVLSAITAAGANITYGFWIARTSREPNVLLFVLHIIRLIDQCLANPRYGLLLLTGLTMAFTTRIPLTTPQLLIALIFYTLAALLGSVAYAPVVRRQINLLESQGFSSLKYPAVAKHLTPPGILATTDVIIIVFLIVVRPALLG